MFIKLFFTIGFFFSIGSFFIAFFIAYEVYQRQKYPRKTVRKKAFSLASFVFVFFWFLSILIGFLIGPIVRK